MQRAKEEAKSAGGKAISGAVWCCAPNGARLSVSASRSQAFFIFKEVFTYRANQSSTLQAPVPAAPVVLAPLHTRGSAECPAHRPCAAPACEPCAFFPHVCALNGRPYHEWCQSCTHRRLFPDTPCRL